MAGKKKGMRAPWWIKLLMVAGILAGVYLIGGYVVLPLVVRPLAVEGLSAALDRPVEIDSLAINPVSLSVSIEGIRLKTKDGSGVTASLDSLFVDAQIESLLRRAVVIREVTLINPYVNVVRRDDGTYNFSYLIKPKAGKKPEKKTGLVNFSVNNIRVIGGSADFSDNPAGVKHTVRNLNVSVPFVSNFGYYTDVFVEPMFSVIINDTPFNIEGKTKPFSDSLETEFGMKFDDLDISRYAAYIPVETGFEVTSGKLSADLKQDYVQYIASGEKEVKVFGLVSLRDLSVRDKAGGGLFELPGLDVDITNIDPIRRKVNLSSVMLDRPRLNVVRDTDGSVNLLNALPQGSKEEAPEEDTGKAAEPATVEGQVPVHIEVDVLGIKSGRVDFEDRVVTGPFRASVYPIDVTVVNFKNIRGWRTSVSVEAVTDAGERVEVSTGVKVNPPGAEGKLTLSGVPVQRYTPYFPKGLRASVEDAVFGMSARFDYDTDPERKTMTVGEMEATLSTLKVRVPGDDKAVLSLKELAIKGAGADVLKKEAVVGSVSLDRCIIELARNRKGELNVAGIYSSSAEDAGKKEKPAKAEDSEPWAVTVAELDLKDFEVGFLDRSPAEPVKVRARDINVSGRNLSTVPDSKGELSLGLRIGEKGVVKVSGPLTLKPQSALMKVKVDGFGLSTYQPYIPEDAGMVLADGYLTLGGEVDYKESDSGPRVEFSGEAALNSIKVLDTINLEDMVNWKSLYVSGVRAGNEPLHADIDEVALTDFFAKLTITEDGRFNLRPKAKEEAVEGEGAAEEPAEPEPEPKASKEKPKKEFKADIKRITLQGGSVLFTDRSLKKTFTASLTELGGHVSGLTSSETKFADMDVRAKYNEFAPIEITGRLNPLRDDLYVDLKARFLDMDLSPLTPYSNKFIGYPITKGKLSLNLEYHIENRKLDSKNVIFVDQLTLGDKVDSPDATSLPVKFAIALLKDRNGEIHIDLPVTGDLDAPDFSIFSLAVQVVVNLVSKAATSPFALLGAIIGGGEELGYLEFGYGVSDIDAEGRDKLDKLAEAIYQRPALKLSISGQADPERDSDALRQTRFMRALKREKLRETVGEAPGPGEAAKALDEVEILPDEYNTYLELAYEEADFPKPRNIIGMLKDLPPEEMEKLMMTNIKITEDDLRVLARERSSKVKEYILSTGKVEPERVFQVEPEQLKPEEKEGVADSRAEFSLE